MATTATSLTDFTVRETYGDPDTSGHRRQPDTSPGRVVNPAGDGRAADSLRDDSATPRLARIVRPDRRRRGSTAIVGFAFALLLASCGSAEEARTTFGEPWQFAGRIPPAITVPVPADGEVVSSLATADRTVVMVAYPGTRLAEVVAFYDDELGTAGTIRSEHTVIAETEAVWMVRWRLAALEVRVVECLDTFTREFSLVCVAIDQHPVSGGG